MRRGIGCIMLYSVLFGNRFIKIVMGNGSGGCWFWCYCCFWYGYGVVWLGCVIVFICCVGIFIVSWIGWVF